MTRRFSPYTGSDPALYDDCPEPTQHHLDKARLQCAFHDDERAIYELAQEYAWQDMLATRRREEDDAELANLED